MARVVQGRITDSLGRGEDWARAVRGRISVAAAYAEILSLFSRKTHSLTF